MAAIGIKTTTAVVALFKIREVFLLQDKNGLYSLPEIKKKVMPSSTQKFMTYVLDGTSSILYAVSPFERLNGDYVTVWKMHCLEKYRPKVEGKWVQIKELNPENLKDGYKSYHSILSAMPYYKYQLTVNDWARTPNEDLQKLQSQLLNNQGSIFFEDMLIRYSLKMDDYTIKEAIKLILANISTSINTKGELFYNTLEATLRSIGSLLEMEIFLRWGRENQESLKKLSMKEIKPYRKAFALLNQTIFRGVIKPMVPKMPDLSDPRFDLNQTDESLDVTDKTVDNIIKRRSTAIELTLVNRYPFLPNIK